MEKELTINGLVEMSHQTASDNGFHDRNDPITPETPEARLAALAPVLTAFGGVVEAIRKPDKLSISKALEGLLANVQFLQTGVSRVADAYLDHLGEHGAMLVGSATQALARMVLIASEVAEACEAIEKRDPKNHAEECADIGIRLGDHVGDINAVGGHFLGPIDLEETILEKDAHNKTRGYRHGNKLV